MHCFFKDKDVVNLKETLQRQAANRSVRHLVKVPLTYLLPHAIRSGHNEVFSKIRNEQEDILFIALAGCISSEKQEKVALALSLGSKTPLITFFCHQIIESGLLTWDNYSSSQRENKDAPLETYSPLNMNLISGNNNNLFKDLNHLFMHIFSGGNVTEIFPLLTAHFQVNCLRANKAVYISNALFFLLFSLKNGTKDIANRGEEAVKYIIEFAPFSIIEKLFLEREVQAFNRTFFHTLMFSRGDSFLKAFIFFKEKKPALLTEMLLEYKQEERAYPLMMTIMVHKPEVFPLAWEVLEEKDRSDAVRHKDQHGNYLAHYVARHQPAYFYLILPYCTEKVLTSVNEKPDGPTTCLEILEKKQADPEIIFLVRFQSKNSAQSITALRDEAKKDSQPLWAVLTKYVTKKFPEDETIVDPLLTLFKQYINDTKNLVLSTAMGEQLEYVFNLFFKEPARPITEFLLLLNTAMQTHVSSEEATFSLTWLKGGEIRAGSKARKKQDDLVFEGLTPYKMRYIQKILLSLCHDKQYKDMSEVSALETFLSRHFQFDMTSVDCSTKIGSILTKIGSSGTLNASRFVADCKERCKAYQMDIVEAKTPQVMVSSGIRRSITDFGNHRL